MGRIRNCLERALNFGRAAVVSLPLLLGTYGCEKHIEPPTVNLEVSPSYGKHPLTSNIKLNGTGDSELKHYILTIGGKKVRDANYPLDTMITFRNYNYTKESVTNFLSGEVIDSEGNSSKDYKNISVSPRGVNRFERPNDTTLNWYGSGDVDKNNILNQNDLTRFDQVIAGTFSDPNDRRLYDRMNVDGSEGAPNGEDRRILEERINGIRDHLPSEWEKLDYEGKKSWFLKMKSRYKPRNIPPSPEYDCFERSNQVFIDFNGLPPDELKKFVEVNPLYDTIDNGRFNLPVDYAEIIFYDSNNNAVYHGINSIVLGKNSLEFKDKYLFAPETEYEIKIPEEHNFYDHFEVYFRSAPVLFVQDYDGKKYIGLDWYSKYFLKGDESRLLETNPKLDIKTEIGK